MSTSWRPAASAASPSSALHETYAGRQKRSVGFDGGLQIDHLPRFHGDTAFQGIASAYGVAYVKALLAALEVCPG